jgi:hypothetical protein
VNSGQHHCLRQQILVLCNCAATPEAWQAVTEDSELRAALKAGEKPNSVVAGIWSMVAAHSSGARGSAEVNELLGGWDYESFGRIER